MTYAILVIILLGDGSNQIKTVPIHDMTVCETAAKFIRADMQKANVTNVVIRCIPTQEY